MVSRRQLIVAGLIVVSASYIVAGGLGQPASNPPEQEELSRSKLVQPVDNGSYLWPYTSRSKSTSGRTLAINLIIHGDDDRVKKVLTEQTRLNWKITEPANETANETGNLTANESTVPMPYGSVNRTNGTLGTANQSNGTLAETDIANETATANTTADNTTLAANTTTAGNESDGNRTRIRSVEIDNSVNWNDAHGSTRYSYIDSQLRDGQATWVDEAYQIHAGSYFGSRYHIRAYTLPATEWTAIQIHQEYWDWFRLRHTVTDIRDSRNALESDFIEQPYVTDISRNYYGVTRGWNDGWLSEIVLAPGIAIALLVGFISTETRRELQRDGRRTLEWLRGNVRGIILASVIAAVYLGVRSAGIMLESVIPELDPRTYIVVLYPTLALGLPVVAFVFAQPYGATSRFERLQWLAKWLGPPIEALPAFGFSLAGLGLAFVFDFGTLGIDAIPVQLALHRIGLGVALGLIAAGATRIDERGGGLLLVGIVGWLVGLGMPLFGYL